MLALIRALRRDPTFVGRLPGLVLAMAVADVLYKFHSFTLECLAFLATWLAFDAVWDRLFGARRTPAASSQG